MCGHDIAAFVSGGLLTAMVLLFFKQQEHTMSEETITSIATQIKRIEDTLPTLPPPQRIEAERLIAELRRDAKAGE